MSERRACILVAADRKIIRYRSKRPPEVELRARLRDLANQRRRFGYRRLFILLREQGERSGVNRIYRLYREEGLTVRKRKARRRAVGTRTPILVEAKVNARWSLDFVHDQFALGRRFRILNIVDDVTRECLAAIASRAASTLTGLLTILIGVVASAAVALGAAGYIQQFVALPQSAIVAVVLVALGLVAAWGILQSVLLASLFTLIEAGGLLAIVVAGWHAGLPLADVLAARVIYGMARQGDLPRFAGHVHPKTATPLIATALIVAATLTLALLIPFERLAEGTSLATLVVFALVNLSLLRLRHRKIDTHGPHVRVPLWVPATGFAVCLAMMAAAVLD
jgi:hypothetical protein